MSACARPCAQSRAAAHGRSCSGNGCKRIGEQLAHEIVVDRAALDEEPFRKDGGFTRLNKVFGGKLESRSRRYQRRNYGRRLLS